MSVLIVTPDIVGPIKNGGIGTACFHYARTLANEGIPTTILFTGEVKNGNEQQWKAAYGQKSIEFLTQSVLSWEQTKTYGLRSHGLLSITIAEFLRHRNFTSVFFQDWRANGFWAMRYKRMGLAFADTTLGVIAHSPTAWQNQGMQTFGSSPVAEAALEWEEKETIAAADVLISPSRHMVEWLRDQAYRLPPRIEICPYTYEDEIYEGPREDADREHLIFFGRLETRKGLHLLGDALRVLQHRGEPLPRKVSLLGKPSTVLDGHSDHYVAQLKADIPGIEWCVETNFDHASSIAYISGENGIVVIPSLLDNYPLTVMEAMANGFCFIASNVGGIPEMVDPAVLFPATVEGLTEKLLNLKGISFRNLHHRHNFMTAREKWLKQVSKRAAPRRAAANAGKSQADGVSICIPFYHHDQYLPRLVNGFLQMRNPGLELVLVNDGTPETACPNFIRLKRELEPFGHVFHTQTNAGAGAARNKAAELARHEKLIFFDSDNVPFPNLVEALSCALQTSGADSVAAPYLAVPPSSAPPSMKDVQYAYLPPGGPISLSLLENCLGDTCGIQLKRVFKKLGGFNTNRSYFDDWEYYIKLVGHGHSHLVYPEPLFYYTNDAAGRRSLDSEYKKMSQLWKGASEIEKESLVESVTILAKQVFVDIYAGRERLSLDNFTFGMTRMRVLLGLYRRLIFQDSNAVRGAISEMARNHGLPLASIPMLSEFLSRPNLIMRLVLHRLLLNQGSAKRMVRREIERCWQR